MCQRAVLRGSVAERHVAIDLRLLRQAEHLLADDVALDLVGAAGDGDGAAPTRSPPRPRRRAASVLVVEHPRGFADQRVRDRRRRVRHRSRPACRASPPGRAASEGPLRPGPLGGPLVGPHQREHLGDLLAHDRVVDTSPIPGRIDRGRSAVPLVADTTSRCAKYASASARASRTARPSTPGSRGRCIVANRRSWASVVERPRHPSPGSPTIRSTGMRASVRNTSLNDAWRFICRSGRTSTPA